MTKQIKKWWESASKGYQKKCKIPIDIHYGCGAPHEKKLKLLGNLKGKKILEIGCGGAQCSIAMAKQGAKVTGIDLSNEQLKFAKELADRNKVNINLVQGDISKLPMVKSNSQDIVFSAWAFMYLSEKQLLSCFKEVKRVLKKGGMFVFSLGHPFYDIIDKKTLKNRGSYFQTGIYKEKYNGGVWVGYTRTISDLVNTIISSGLIIEKMIEPDSRKKNPGDPWYNLWNYIPKYMNIVPPTIIFKCRKPKNA